MLCPIPSILRAPLKPLLSAFLIFACLVALPAAAAISFGQVDTFQDLTTDNWGTPANNTFNISSGGPAGAGDAFIQVSSGTFGGGLKLLTFNQSQWTGDFLDAGVSEVVMNLKNFGSTILPIRIAIREGTGGSSTPGYASTVAFNLPADGAWHAATFFLNAASLTPINSPQPLATDLANVADFRILSSASPSLLGDNISAQIGIDNISAVPEPATGALLVIGLIGLGNLKRCRKP